MVLATHAVVGAAIAQFFPEHKVLAFCLGFVSHFLLDAIPHWDYHLASKKENANPLEADIVVGPALMKDLVKIGFDACLGLFLSLILFRPDTITLLLVTLLGAFGGMAPDALQFLYYRLRVEPVVSLQRFHIWIHARLHLKGYPLPGATLQAILVLIIVSITYIFT